MKQTATRSREPDSRDAAKIAVLRAISLVSRRLAESYATKEGARKKTFKTTE